MGDYMENGKLNTFEELKKKARENPYIARFLDDESLNVELMWNFDEENPELWVIPRKSTQ